MKYELDGITYDVVIQKKNNKNTYIRVKEDMTIFITTSYFVSKKEIEQMLENNESYLRNMLKKRKHQQQQEENFFFLGKKYDIIVVPTMHHIEIVENKIYIKDEKQLNRWLKKQMEQIFLKRLDILYQNFEENIPYPKLKIRDMKTRWGVCNRKTLTITLNAKLIRMDISKLDYVIVHELSHFVHFNHSSSFWKCVEKYYPQYKKVRKELRD